MPKRNPKPVQDRLNKAIVIRLSEKVHRRLKKLSYLTDKSMSMLAAECIDKMLQEQKNVLTNSDIMI